MSEPLPEGLSIRRAGSSDVARIRELTRAAYAKWVPLIGREPLPMTADYKRAVVAHVIDLLFAGAEMAGLIETVPESGELLIENLAVAPEFQGRGHGRYLLAHAESLAASLGLPRVRLYTNKRFEENIAFYGRHGYAVDREEAFPGAVAVHMSKPVAIAKG